MVLDNLSDTEAALIKCNKTEKLYTVSNINISGGVCDCCQFINISDVDFAKGVQVYNFTLIKIVDLAKD